MTLNEYQQLAARTINRGLNSGEAERHALHGMAAEVGELHGLYQKTYQGHTLDMDHAVKEMGDALWFMAEWCTANGLELETVGRVNILKLMDRYPEGFEEERSLHRAEGDL